MTVTDQSGLHDAQSQPVSISGELPDLAVQSIDSVVNGNGTAPSCVVNHTLANVGAGHDTNDTLSASF